jgi:hypothetical protein
MIILFTRNKDITGLNEPTLCNELVQSNEVKYLGPTLDKGLTWEKQLDSIANKAYRAFQACRSTFGRTWELRLKVVYWIYTVVVSPTVTYSATVWWPRSNSKSRRAELIKLQRMACLGNIGAMKTTPMAVIEVLIGLPLPHTCSRRLRLEQEFIDSTAVDNGNPNLKVLDGHT